MNGRIATIALGLTLLTAAISCGSTSISGKGTGGTGGTTGGLAAGSPCTMSAQCASGDCGTGNCCATACSTSDPVCGALGCDDAGACVYPSAGTSCPGTACSGSLLNQKACDGAGACQPEKLGTACPGNYACGTDGSCVTSCNSSEYCASGFVCNAGTCTKPVTTGTCTENDDCASEVCGVSGTGLCCRAACVTGNATCGATGCDDGGACLYPASSVVCGPVQESCTGSTQTNAQICDGLGHCGGGMTDCAPFTCGANACKTDCVTSADCVTGQFCDALNAVCCVDVAAGATLAIDSVLGDDAAACCGYGDGLPCRSITHAMSLVGAGSSEDTTLQVTVNGAASGDWTAEGETYPIELGWGAELNAPGIFFQGPLDAGTFRPVGAIFELTADAGGAESASIVGTVANPVGIGMDQHGGQLVAGDAITVDQGSTLYLANASVNGSWWDDCDAIYATGTLILGQDRSGVVTGPVQIGNDLGNADTDGYTGILCDGCTLSDVPTNGASSVVIAGQRLYGIDAEGSASISLTSAPVLGIAPSSVGFDTCPSRAGYSGIYAAGTVTMSLDHATIQCIAGLGISFQGASLTLNDATIQNSELALEVSAGSAVVSNSTIRYNSGGVIQELSGVVDLSGGAVGGRNTVACSRTEGYYYYGVSVVNETSATLNASNVDWDTPGPDLFSCDSDFSVCSCQIAACTDLPDAGGLDAVVIDGGGTILTTGNGLSPLNCAAPPG